MVSLKDLVHVSFQEFPESYWESFEELNNLYVDRLPVVVGYHGNLYGIFIKEHSAPWLYDPSYRIDVRYKVDIWDITNNKIAGEGDFDLGYVGGHFSYTMSKIRKEIKKAIIRANMKPTDFYK